MISGGNRSGRVLMTWPSLMKVAPRVVIACRSSQPRSLLVVGCRRGPHTNSAMPSRAIPYTRPHTRTTRTSQRKWRKLPGQRSTTGRL